MNMQPTLEQFYKEILSYAGLKQEDGVIVNVSDKLGDVKIDGKTLALPYNEVLKNPEGKIIFHPLNENYANPDNAQFSLYRKKLVFELNLRLSTLIISLLKVGSEPLVQQRLKSTEAIELLSHLGEVEMSMIDHFVSLVKAAQAERGEQFLFEVFTKKHGEHNGHNVEAIGKINFKLYSDLKSALDSGEYKACGVKLRKKDIVAFIQVFQAIFPDIEKPNNYMTGTDNKVFRMLSVLLTTTYGVAYQINQTAMYLEESKDPSLALEEAKSDLRWSTTLPDVLGLTDEIRQIPSQTDLRVEAHKLKIDESKVKNIPQMTTAPVYQPQQSQQTQAPVQMQTPQPQPVQQYQPQQPQQQQQLSPEDIIRGQVTNPMMGMQQPMMMGMQQPVMQQPMMMPMQGMQQPMMMGMQQPMMQQPMMMPMQQTMPQQQQMPGGWSQFSPQPQMQQPMMQQPMMMPMQGMQQPQSTGIAFNPQLMGGRMVSNFG